MMKKQLVVLLVALVSSNAALADSTGDTMHSKGMYATLGVGAGTTGYSGDLKGYANGNGTANDTNIGGRATFGYIWNQNFDTEVSYYDFGGSKLSNSSSAGSGKYSIMQQAVALTAVGRLPVEDSGSDFYAKAGLAYTWVNAHITDNPTGQASYDKKFTKAQAVPLVGLGYELNVGHHWAMSAEFVKVFPTHKDIGDPNSSKLADASLYSVGATYKF